MTTIIPKTKKSLDFINKVMDKKALKNLFSQLYLEFGSAKTGHLADTLKNLGFRFATKAGTTISISDLDVNAGKKELLKKAEDEINTARSRYLKGDITEVERYTKVIDTWSEATENLTKSVVESFDRLNPVYMMAFSGARGNISQVSQLVGMRGLMADAQGQIIDLPIKSNFREGLSVTEYIISSYGARKGLVDTALKTADSGYLTRRLVDVAQDVIIRGEDCGTGQGIEISAITEGENISVPLSERLLGRTLAQDIKDEKGNVIVTRDTFLNAEDVNKITETNIKKVKIRSPLTCELEYGVCQKCYGWALTSNRAVDLGEAIGIIAAQSIGEPGTQLTMRTFHTGGVFRGSSNMQQIVAKEEGKIKSVVNTRETRTRHGDVVDVSVKEGVIEVETKDKKISKYNVPYGAVVFFKKGDSVKKKDVIAEFEPSQAGEGGRLTEKATKDITSDLSGSITFDGFNADEKKDRQGNTSRTANRNGTIWVLSGDVYNLPGGSKVLVKDGQQCKEGDILAETSTISEHGGEVRYGENIEIEEVGTGKNKITKIVKGKELTIVIASISSSNATLETTKKEQIWKVNKKKEEFVIKAPVGIDVENGTIIAEFIDEENVVTSSGEVRYDDIEVDEETMIVTKPGKVLFIPEEIHQISKDSSLKMVESGTFVEVGTEIVKDLRCNIAGIVDIKEYNDIITEVTIRPGEIHKVEDITRLKVEDGDIVEAGTEIIKGVKAKEKSLVTLILPEGSSFDLEDEIEEIEDQELPPQSVDILLRPVQEFEITPREVAIKFKSTNPDLIDIVSVTQLQYKNGARIRNIEGASLTRISLVLQMQEYLTNLKGRVELTDDGNLRIVVLENLIVRREGDDLLSTAARALQTEILVKDGDTIKPKTPVSKTQVLAVNDGEVRMKKSAEDTRRLLILGENSQEVIKLKGKATVKKDDLIRQDQIISDKDEKVEMSGQVLSIKGNEVVLRTGRPYLISVGTQLQVEENGLVQRGDLLATLIFERQKTGDIVQGLPKVEELLEARKPKESCILAEDDGVAEIEYEEDMPVLYLVTDKGRQEIKVPLDSSIIVADKEKITKGQPLTSGPQSPHDIVRLRGIKDVQQYLVEEVQRVYRSQGVEIADKHIEVIVRQMTKKVRIEDSGDTKFLPGEMVEERVVQEQNAEIEKVNGQPAVYGPILLGITKASLNTESFISAASFQETTRILTEVAVEGKKDLLRGLKENVIIGRLIPAGTGFYHLNYVDEAEEERREKAARASAARKPSAILEEIEGMFGSGEFSMEEMDEGEVPDMSIEDEDFSQEDEE